MNFEGELSAKQPLVYASDVFEDYSKSTHYALKRPDNITKKCSKKECINNVELYKDNYEYVSKTMFKTAYGYRNKYSSFCLYHFCSDECKENFKKHNRCYKCNEDCTSDGKGTFVETLGYTLCNSRCDMDPPCMSNIVSYELEKRFAQEYKRSGYYKIDSEVINNMLRGCDGLKRIIADNGNMVSYNMLKDMYKFSTEFKVQERENEELTDEETFNTYYNMVKDEFFF